MKCDSGLRKMETSFTYNIKKSSVGLSQRSATPAKQHVNTICRLPARVQLQRRLVCSDRLATCKASIIAPGDNLCLELDGFLVDELPWVPR